MLYATARVLRLLACALAPVAHACERDYLCRDPTPESFVAGIAGQRAS